MTTADWILRSGLVHQQKYSLFHSAELNPKHMLSYARYCISSKKNPRTFSSFQTPVGMGKVFGKPSLTQGTLCCVLLSGSLGKGWVGAMGDESCCVMVLWQDGRGTIIAVYL